MGIEEHPHKNTPERAERKLCELPVSIERYRAFVQHFQPSISSVYYPSCGEDISPSKAFSQAKIIYADNDPNVVRAFRKKGLPIKGVDATTYRLRKPADVVILRNSTIDPAGPLKNLAKNGYLLYNHWLGDANILETIKKMPGYEFAGVIKDNPERPGKGAVDMAYPQIDAKKDFSGMGEDYMIFKKTMDEKELHPEPSLAEKIGSFLKKLFSAASHGSSGHKKGGH